MADLSYIEKNKLEKLFGMKSGYVLNFSDKTFREFVFGSTGKDIYDSEFAYSSGSKANRLRAFWSIEPNEVVGKLIDNLITHLSEEDEGVSKTTLFTNCRGIADRLLRVNSRDFDSSTEHHLLSINPTATEPSRKDDRNIFVVHGRNLAARNALFRFLRSIGLRPMEWSQAVNLTGKGSPYIGEILDAAFAHAQAVVVLMTPDDEARLRSSYRVTSDPDYEHSLTAQSRPNVLFEAGMAMGRDSSRTILIELGHLRPFSDIGGRHVVRLDNSVASRQNIANRLKKAGCAIDLTGTDWHSEGDFDPIVTDEITFESAEEDAAKIDVNAIFARLSYLGIYQDFFLHYEIPPTVRRNALNLIVRSNEQIMAFLDNTEATSGRNGIAFTDSGMYCRNSREEPLMLPWEELCNTIVIESDRYDEVRVGEHRLDLATATCQQVTWPMHFVRLLQ